MKKGFAIIFVLLMLVLWGCDAGVNEPEIPTGNGISNQTNPTGILSLPDGETVEHTRPAEAVLISFDKPALKVTVTINPELELTLSFTNRVLEAKALNADAENLLVELELVGQSYSNSMSSILGEAQEQGFLTDSATVSISVSKLAEDSWNAASERILTDPVEAFQEDTGIILKCELHSPGESGPVIARTHTNQRDGYQEVICYDAYGNHVMSKSVYDNGDYEERHFSTGETFFWGNDGTYRYSKGKDGVHNEFTDYPDGTRSTITRTFDTDDNLIWSLEERRDGYTNESFWKYENGVLVHFYSEVSNGRVDSYYYDANGNPTYMLILDEFGNKIECFYENGECIRDTCLGKDGSKFDRLFENGVIVHSYSVDSSGRVGSYDYDSNGNPTYTLILDEFGNKTERFYEDGECKRDVLTNKDGSKEERIYENGVHVLSIYTTVDGTVYEETQFTGEPEQDDAEHHDTYYDNGNLKTSEVIYPNGDYIKFTFYENGNEASYISQSGDDYYEYRNDEYGNMTYQYYKDADGNEELFTYYSNGNDKTYEAVSPDHGYTKASYYENGVCASSIWLYDGYYIEIYKDENGWITRQFERDPDGTEYVGIIENGELIGKTVTYPNGDTMTIK